MHNLKGLEKLNSKFYTMQETVVDIEVKTSDAEDAVEEAQSISADIEEDLDTVEGANDEIETLRLYQKHLKEYPLTKASYSLINLNNSLSKYSTQLVAVESFNTSITNDIVISGIEGIVGQVVDKIKSMVKDIVDKFKALSDKIKLAIGDWESALEAAQRLIQTIPDTPSAEVRSSVIRGIEFKQCDQVIAGIEAITAKIKNMGDILTFEDNKKIIVKSIYELIDHKTLDIVGFGKSKYPAETKIDAAKFNKQELSNMCAKLIKSCQNAMQLDDLLYNMISHVPAVTEAMDSPGFVSEILNTDAAKLHRSMIDLINLDSAMITTLSNCNKSFIRIVKARAKM